MAKPIWICSETDKAYGKECFVCQLKIETGQEIIYAFGEKSFRHTSCILPKKDKEKILTEDEIRRDQFKKCGVSSRSGVGDWREDASPSQENAIGDMEGD